MKRVSTGSGRDQRLQAGLRWMSARLVEHDDGRRSILLALGKVFEGWSDGVMSAERIVVPGPDGVELTARFR